MLPFSDGGEEPGGFVCKIFTPFSRMVNIFYSKKWYQNFDFSWTCSSHRNTVSNGWQVDSRTTRKHKGIATVFLGGRRRRKKKRYNNRKQDRWCDHEPHSRFFIPCPLDWRRVETNSQWYHPRDDRLVTNAQSRLRSPTFFLHNDKICGPHENDKIDYWLNQLPHVSRFSQRLCRRIEVQKLNFKKFLFF